MQSSSIISVINDTSATKVVLFSNNMSFESDLIERINNMGKTVILHNGQWKDEWISFPEKYDFIIHDNLENISNILNQVSFYFFFI